MHAKALKQGLFILLLLPLPGYAHINKPYDRNGGHYDDFGNYHCHDSFCRLTESRHQRRLRPLSPRERDNYYLKEDWPHWEYTGSGCQDARNQVLVYTSKTPVTFSNPRNCVVREGLWVDEYSGEEFTRAGQLEIDHIISPAYANASNGYRWNLQTRMAFANDPLNLIPVSRKSFRKKRGREIAYWQPREEYVCEYAANWQAIAEKYELDLALRDRSKVKQILNDCDEALNSQIEDREP